MKTNNKFPVVICAVVGFVFTANTFAKESGYPQNQRISEAHHKLDVIFIADYRKNHTWKTERRNPTPPQFRKIHPHQA